MIGTNESNWATEETSKFNHKKAVELSKQHQQREKRLIKEGKKKVLIPHPTLKNTLIEKYV